MCATRSSTIATSSNPSRPKAPFLWRSSTRSRKPTRPVIFSAHGVPQSVPAAAEARQHVLPRCHLPARLQGARGGARATTRTACEIVLIGHAGHPEVIGTLGQLPAGAVTLIETAADAAALHAARSASGSPTSPRPRFRSTTPPPSSPSCSERFPDIVGPQQGGHLLRHHQPPGGGQGHRRRAATG